MSLGLVLLEEKMFTQTQMPTPQSDAIMSADIKMAGKNIDEQKHLLCVLRGNPHPGEIVFNTMKY